MGPETATSETDVDILIIGAGPAGLMAAASLAHLASIPSRSPLSVRIIDKRYTKIFSGQADGLQCRSLEIFDSLGFADRAWKEANHMIEICMWNPDASGTIQRSDRIPDTIVGLSKFQQIVLHQGRIERFFLDNIQKYSRGAIKVERGVLPMSLEIGEERVKVKVRRLTEEEAAPPQVRTGSKNDATDGLFRSNLVGDDYEDQNIARESSGEEEVIKARFVIGCDGARSWTRRALGPEFELQGEATDFIWGVMDIIPITDFPDIRMRCAIHSANDGSLMVIPRENRLVRLYIQLKEVTPDASGRADRSKITPELIFSAAQKILKPYKIDYEYCDWWTAYQIGQRISPSFSHSSNKVFLAGDAVHTHSPKAGQGMNVSMQDSFNLGWKVGLVAKGICHARILDTYQSERRRVAQDLIEFDHKFSRLFSGRPAKDVMDAEGVSMAEFKDAFLKGNLFASGLSVNYGPSALVVKSGDPGELGDRSERSRELEGIHKITGETFLAKQSLAKGLPVGMRVNSFKVLNQACARPWHFQERLKADGRFRVVLFAGNILDRKQKERVEVFCAKLGSPDGFLRRATPEGAKIDSVIEVLTIHSAKRTETELLRDFPDILHPFDPHTGWDYNKVFVDDESYHEGFGDAYGNYGVDKERGCLVAVRPDQYVGWIGELEDFEQLQKYFEGILVL
ncbi:FAD binding domain-containing protein [Apiosordaria backusii]|uniref:FAD binding domain-containing protein n=1 Tax=Apiosordaria backusii TaxID=314023 RepID=A0AA40DR08_9PEZI|nr:FAD binding domain-containing protein [Apiosordaria backusii]